MPNKKKENTSNTIISWVLFIILLILGFVVNHYYLIYQLNMAKQILKGA